MKTKICFGEIHLRNTEEEKRGEKVDNWAGTNLYPGVSLIASTFHHPSIRRTNITHTTNEIRRQANYKYYKYHQVSLPCCKYL